MVRYSNPCVGPYALLEITTERTCLTGQEGSGKLALLGGSLGRPINYWVPLACYVTISPSEEERGNDTNVSLPRGLRHWDISLGDGFQPKKCMRGFSLQDESSVSTKASSSDIDAKTSLMTDLQHKSSTSTIGWFPFRTKTQISKDAESSSVPSFAKGWPKTEKTEKYLCEFE